MLASAVSAVVAAALRTWGMGVLPIYDLETFVLLVVRNCSGYSGR